MIINKLSLTNYRAYDRLDITFEKDITVLYGENGVGKSSMLVALSRLLSSILPITTYSDEQPQSFRLQDIKHNKKFYEVVLEVDLLDGRLLLYQDFKNKDSTMPITIKNNKIKEEHISLENQVIKMATLFSPDTVYIDNKAVKVLKQTEVTLGSKVGKSSFFGVFFDVQRSNPEIPRTLPDKSFDEIEAAYSRALTGDRIQLIKAIELMSLLVKDPNKKNIVKAIINSVSSILPDYSVSFSSLGRIKIEKDDDKFDFIELSDGEKGIIAMVIDLARRLAIANPELKNPIKNGQAIVIIDEIELHLHPRWQRIIIRRLHDTFPKCQFIFTTHSPQVLGEVDARCVRHLYREPDSHRIKCEMPTQSYGLDSDEVLEDLMDVPTSTEEFEDGLKQVYAFIDNSKLEQASKLLDELEIKSHGSVSRTIKPRVMIKMKSINVGKHD